SSARLRVGHYRSTCPLAETIIRRVVERWHAVDPTITAALLRINFHDCFVKGCDAALLIDPTPQNPQPQKTAPPNRSIRGFDLIDAVKSAVEFACPATVSCADVISLATRDAVSLAGGPKYVVPTGRLDGISSSAADVKLPPPSLSVNLAYTQFFQPLGFTLPEIIVLLGSHTVGSAHCSTFQDRVVNFMTETELATPTSMDPTLVRQLMVTCGRGGGNATAALDQGTPLAFDGSFYREIERKRGVLSIDQELGTNPLTSRMVSRLGRDELRFRRSFGATMVKMGRLVGSGIGEIRKNCRLFNGPNS
ncbi:Peroxidase 57, partial [Linum perenne]